MSGFTQPELGKTILELRNQKKWTQEELVERCSLNVRTLQRIEAGEVTPRDYTVRAILGALEYDIESIENTLTSKATLKWLNIGWISGIIYFVSGFGEIWVDFERFEPYSYYFPLIYTAVKLIVLMACSLFFYGFVKIGEWFSSDLIKVASYLMITTTVIIVLFDVLSLFSDFGEEEFMGIKLVEGACIGAIGLLFGISLYRLKDRLGTSAQVAGIFEIITGGCFATVILAPVGLFLVIPATILDIVVLFKAQSSVQTAP